MPFHVRLIRLPLLRTLSSMVVVLVGNPKKMLLLILLGGGVQFSVAWLKAS